MGLLLLGYACFLLALKISQVAGVGLVSLSGGQKPAIRIQADLQALAPLDSVIAIQYQAG